jgi:hypothetical protein
MAAGRDDKRFEVSYRRVSNDNEETKEENETHFENREPCQREHTRRHVDEAVVVELNEKKRECVRFDTGNALDLSAYVEFLQRRRSFETNDANQSVTAQIKQCLIHRDTLLVDEAEIIRCLDDKVLGHEKQSKFQSISGRPDRSWRW